MITSTLNEPPAESSTQQSISLLLIAAGILFGLAFW